MDFKKSVLILAAALWAQYTFAQRNYEGYNLLGIQGGISMFDIQTDDFTTEQKLGFTAGFTTRGAFRNNFDLIYGLSFMSASIGINGSGGAGTQNISYTLQGAQLGFLGSYNIVKKHFSLELGPVFGLNGKMKLDQERYADYVLTGYNQLTAKDIQDISRFQVYAAGGFTAGLEHFRISAQYQYGITNMFGKLNSANLEKDDFEGHSSTVVLAAVIYF